MKPLFVFVLVFSLGVFSVSVMAQTTQTAAADQTGKPKIDVQQPVFEAGPLYRSKTKLEHAFEIKNTGNADLKILSARPGCGCTVTKFDQLITPGTDGKVYASVDVSHFKGPIEKYVDVETNDPVQPHLKLTIKADVKTYVDIRPMDQIRFNVSKGASDTKELTITPTYEKPIKLLTPQNSNPDAFDVKLEPPAGDSKDYKLTVVLKDTAKIGNQSGVITIPVEDNVAPAQEVSVFAAVRGAIAAEPALVSFQVKTFPEEVSPISGSNIYQQDDETTVVVTKSQAGDPLRVIAQKDDWYQVITGGEQPKVQVTANQPTVPAKVGWIKKASVKVTKDSQAPGPQTIVLKKTSGNFKVIDYSSTLPQVKLELESKAPEANTFVLKAMLPNPQETKKNGPPGTIIVRTDDPDQPEIKVPLYVIVS